MTATRTFKYAALAVWFVAVFWLTLAVIEAHQPPKSTITTSIGPCAAVQVRGSSQTCR